MTSDMKAEALDVEGKKSQSIEAKLEATDESKEDSDVFSFVAIDEKRLVRKIDFTLIPWLSLLYLMSFLDRVGIGNARLYGMEEDLGISDTQYLVALSMFFVTYALFETPSNLLLKRLRPSIWLSTIMLGWGITTTCQGLIHNFGGLLSLRILLGVFEAGFFPGAVYYLSCWYKRNEIGFRLAVFTSASTFAGAFGGLLAAGISNMEGVGGKPAWAWIFIIEGVITVVIAAASYFIVQDFPDTARFLSEPERALVVSRLQKDSQASAGGEKLRLRSVRQSVVDYKTWLGAMCIVGFGGSMYAFALFLPSIINQLGFTATRSNLLTVPVYFAASILSCVLGYIADRLKQRGKMSMALHATIAVAYIILLCSRQPALSYFATYVAAFGIFPGSPTVFAWISNNVEGSYKRGVTLALMITCGNLTGIISSNTYRQRDTPWYTLGHAVTLSFAVIGLTGSTTMFFLLRRENARRDRGERNEVIGDSKDGDPRNGCYESEDAAMKDKGDEWSGFRYIT